MTTITDHDVERYADVDLYGVLHLTAEAGAELIDRAYRVRVNDVHPDHAGAASTDLATLVNAAGAILRQTEARARYDALRTAWRAKHDSRERDAQQRRVRGLEEQLAQARQDLVLAQQDLAASQAELARIEVELAASEASRRELAEQVRWLAGQLRSARADGCGRAAPWGSCWGWCC